MAVQLQSDSNIDLVKKLQDFGVIKHKLVANVMKETDRKFYSNLSSPYVDRIELISQNSVLPAPHMHAYALEKLVDCIKHDSKILDLGSGTGYMAACFARIIQERAIGSQQEATGVVIAVEPDEKIFKISVENILTDNSELLRGGLIKIFHGEGKKECTQFGPFEVIHVTKAVPEIPMEYSMNLTLNGRMICPVRDHNGVKKIIQCDKDSEGKITEKVLTNVTFDPLMSSSDSMVE